MKKKMNQSLNRAYRIQIDNSLSQFEANLGIHLTRFWGNQSESMDFAVRVHELPKPYGFELAVTENFLSWEISLKLDDFANGIVEKFQENFETSPEVCIEYINLTEAKSKKFEFDVNGSSVLTLLPGENWNSIHFKLTRIFDSLEDAPRVFDSTLLDIFSILLPLSGTVSLEENTSDVDAQLESGYKEEGQKITMACAKYERNRFNRRLCLNHYGYRCFACGILLGEKYGDAGRDYIHVHHLTPLSKMPAPAILNPIKDLIPLCPNCHNVAHRRNPPYNVEELREFLSGKN